MPRDCKFQVHAFAVAPRTSLYQFSKSFQRQVGAPRSVRKRAVQGGILVKVRNGRVPVDERILKIAKRPAGLIGDDEAFFR